MNTVSNTPYHTVPPVHPATAVTTYNVVFHQITCPSLPPRDQTFAGRILRRRRAICARPPPGTVVGCCRTSTGCRPSCRRWGWTGKPQTQVPLDLAPLSGPNDAAPGFQPSAIDREKCNHFVPPLKQLKLCTHLSIFSTPTLLALSLLNTTDGYMIPLMSLITAFMAMFCYM